MERTNFEKLRVYRLAENLADGIWAAVRNWDYLAKDTVGRQMIRAADSIGANIAEGTGRGTLQDNRRFIRMARGSLYETQHWLRRAYKRTLLNKQQVASLTPIISELSPKLNAYFRSVNTAALINGKQSTKLKIQSSKARPSCDA
ncbi:MAG: four helix bundle protein [Pyrinomonadaceae bacterium]